MLAARYETEVDALTGKVAPVQQSHRHLQHLLGRFSVFLVSRHRREVCPLVRRVMLPIQLAQPVSISLQDGLRFFPPPYPHRRWSALRLPSLSCERSDTGLPRSPRLTGMGEVRSMRREHGVSMTGKWTIPVPCYGALLAQASQHL